MSPSTTNTNRSSDYSVELEAYRQSGNICAFLNISFDKNQSATFDELTEKFAAFDAAGLHLSSSSFLELVVPSILRQFTVSRCSYEYQLLTIDEYKNYWIANEAKGYVSPVVPQLIVPSTMSLLAVLLNISLLIVTARKISMSTVCNWLLAFDSFCQIPALLPFLVNLVALCARLDAIDYRVCLTSLMLSTGFSHISFLAIYFMSLERLLIAMMPMRMSQISEKTVKHCSLLAVLACCCFAVAMVLSIFNVRIDTNLYMYIYVNCNIGFYMYSLSFYYVSHTILGLALLNYVLIAVLIVWRRIYVPSTQTDSNNNAAYSQATHRMLRSVSLISLIFLIGWLVGSVLVGPIAHGQGMLADKIASALFGDSDEDAKRFSFNLYIWMGLTLCLLPMAAGMNAPVLIINNPDYREAYKKTLALLPLICRKRTSPAVGPMFTDE